MLRCFWEAGSSSDLHGSNQSVFVILMLPIHCAILIFDAQSKSVLFTYLPHKKIKWFPAVWSAVCDRLKGQTTYPAVFLSALSCRTVPFLLFLLINYRRSEQTSLVNVHNKRNVSLTPQRSFGQLVNSCNKDDDLKLLLLTGCAVLHFTSRNICINFPQIRFLMKSYSFIRETAPVVMKNPPKEGTVL